LSGRFRQQLNRLLIRRIHQIVNLRAGQRAIKIDGAPVGFIEMLAWPDIMVLLRSKSASSGLVFSDAAGRPSTSFTMANSTSPTFICVAFQSLWTLCSAPGLFMQY
jgi:hypothetical protein